MKSQLREKAESQICLWGRKAVLCSEEEATRKEGVTGELLLQYLERRLDNAVFRLGFKHEKTCARQIVSHVICFSKWEKS